MSCTDKSKTGKAGKSDPFWNSVASFDLDEIFVLPGWISKLRGERNTSDRDIISVSIDSELEALKTRVGDCSGCRLSAERNSIVFGGGNPAAGIVIIGEGPGANEDKLGKPFVGRAGKLLDRILAAIDLDRTSVFITNIVKCRPPGNRTPSKDEVAACLWILEEQIKIMNPGVILTLGAPASRTIIGSTDGIGKLRGSIHRYGEIPVIPTYHPAALLRTDALRRPVWEDMKMLKQLLLELGLPRTEKDQA
ncbi:MAG: uracil-DNA glycosylase [Candidatus Aegiribacteria sp.]|nr:uracil-DNA glycosylase [Candidatus Aegiribacteria sp.]